MLGLGRRFTRLEILGSKRVTLNLKTNPTRALVFEAHRSCRDITIGSIRRYYYVNVTQISKINPSYRKFMMPWSLRICCDSSSSAKPCHICRMLE